MRNTHDLIGIAKEGLVSTAVVVANTSLYPSNQMWKTFSAIDMTNAKYIELDI